MGRALAVAALTLLTAACAAPPPTPASLAPATGTPAPAPSAPLPPTTCNNAPPSWWTGWRSAGPDGSAVPVAITLTCEGAVRAAWALVQNPGDVVSAEFNMGDHCLPEMMCPASEPNTGQVVFHLRDGVGRYIVVSSDAAGHDWVSGDWGEWNGWASPSPS